MNSINLNAYSVNIILDSIDDRLLFFMPVVSFSQLEEKRKATTLSHD